MPNILEVIQELKRLQAKEAANTATAADKARIAELQGYMKGAKKPDPAPAGPPVRPPAAPPPAAAKPPVAAAPPKAPVAAAPPRPAAPATPAASVAGKPAAPPVATRPAAPAAAAAPARPAPARPAAKPGEPDGSAFALSLDSDLLGALEGVDEGDDASPASATTFAAADEDVNNPFALKIDDPALAGDPEEPDDSDAAKTTFAVDEEEIGAAKAGADNPFALAVPDDLEQIDLPEDNEGGVTHELAENELDDVAADGGDPYKVAVKDDFAKALAKSDGKGVAVAPPGPKGTPMVPDAHYEKLQATDTSVVVQLRDGRLAKGVAGAFAPTAPSFTLNQLVPGKAPVAIKLDECLTVRFVRAYNQPAALSAPFPPNAKVTGGEKAQVQLLDGEKLVGAALPHKDGESFIMVPAVATGNVRRVWIHAKAVRSYTKLP